MERAHRQLHARGGALAQLVGRPWFWALAVGLLFGLPLVRALRSPPPRFPPLLGPFPAFVLTRPDGTLMRAADLEGKVWVAGAFAVDGDTPATTAMHDLERRMRKLGEGFQLVSFTLDAARDTPARLGEYGRAHHTNPRRWSLLGGAPDALARALAPLGKSPSTLVLVDSHGRMRGTYAVDAAGTIDQLVFDAALLVNDY
jgi:cytochrome oxidase Cu insertion factor (SCO1/SenC/PrrC family)